MVMKLCLEVEAGDHLKRRIVEHNAAHSHPLEFLVPFIGLLT